MQKLTLTIIAFVFAFAVQAQKKETRQVGEFDYVSFGISGDLIITQGNSNSLVLIGDADDLEKIETYVSGGKLKIRRENNNSWFGDNLDDVTVKVTLKNFTGASVSGSGKITNSNNLDGRNVSLSVSGSGKMDLYVECEDIETHISGSGRITLEGKASTNDLHISGSGGINASEFTTNRLEAHISGSGSAKVKVKDEIDAHISGSGSIRYIGDPSKIREKVSGSGSVRSM